MNVSQPGNKDHLVIKITWLQRPPGYKDHMVTKITGNKDHR